MSLVRLPKRIKSAGYNLGHFRIRHGSGMCQRGECLLDATRALITLVVPNRDNVRSEILILWLCLGCARLADDALGRDFE